MKPKWLLIALFTLALGRSETFSQEKTASDPEGTLDLTLEACVEIALKNNPEVVNSRYNVDIQALALRTAKGRLLPSIDSRYGVNKAITGPRPGQFLDPVTQQVITSPGRSTVSSSHSVGANISIPIYNANTLASIAADRAGLRGRKQDLRGSRVSTIHAVKKRFFEVLQAEKLLALNQESVRTAEESLRRSKTMYEIGSVAVSDVLKARSALEALKVTVITQDNEMKIARSNLAFVLGIDVNRSIRLKAGDLTVEPMALSYEQALTKAVDRRPDLQSKNFDLEQTRRQMDAARALIRRPTVSMSAGYSWRTQNTPFQGIEDLFLQNYSYTFGLNISLPIFNGMRTENQGGPERAQVSCEPGTAETGQAADRTGCEAVPFESGTGSEKDRRAAGGREGRGRRFPIGRGALQFRCGDDSGATRCTGATLQVQESAYQRRLRLPEAACGPRGRSGWD